MTQAQQPEALRLARLMRDGETFARHDYTDAANVLEMQHVRIAELEAERDQAKSAVSGLNKRKDDWKWRAMKAEAELAIEAARTAEENLRANQMSQQHDMQAALNREAREQLAALKAAPAAQAQDVQRDAVGFKTADGVNVLPGDKVWVRGSSGIHESTVDKAVTNYMLFSSPIPVDQSYSSESAIRAAIAASAAQGEA